MLPTNHELDHSFSEHCPEPEASLWELVWEIWISSPIPGLSQESVFSPPLLTHPSESGACSSLRTMEFSSSSPHSCVRWTGMVLAHRLRNNKNLSRDLNSGICLCPDWMSSLLTYGSVKAEVYHISCGRWMGSLASSGFILSPSFHLVPTCSSIWSPNALALGKQRAEHPRIHSKSVLLGA